MNLALVAGAAVVAVVLVHGATFLIARRVGRYNVVDIAWGIGFVAVAAVAAALGSGDLFRRMLVLGLTAVWGLRLAGFLLIDASRLTCFAETRVHRPHRHVSPIDVATVGFVGNGFQTGTLDHCRLIHQYPGSLRIRSLLHDRRQRVELADHHRRHPTTGLAYLLERPLHQTLVADLIGDHTDDSTMVSMNLSGTPYPRDFA